MTLKRILPILVALAATAGTGVATAQTSDTPRLASAPFLGRISGGAAVRYALTRTPGSQTVTIAGRTATVKLTQKSKREYTALVHAPGLEAGRTYTVTITAIARSGRTKLTFRKSLYMHSSLNQPPSSG
jgi:ABC-type phosphate transport system substrate-binding protein